MLICMQLFDWPVHLSRAKGHEQKTTAEVTLAFSTYCYKHVENDSQLLPHVLAPLSYNHFSNG